MTSTGTGTRGVDLADAVELARLVADPMRARILELLAAEQLCVCHLQEELRAKQTLVSHHLRVLRDAGIVQGEACGRFTYYRLCPGSLDGATAALVALAAASTATPPRRAC